MFCTSVRFVYVRSDILKYAMSRAGGFTSRLSFEFGGTSVTVRGVCCAQTNRSNPRKLLFASNHVTGKSQYCTMGNDNVNVHQEEARRFMQDCLVAAGAPAAAAAQQAAVMLEADRQGHYSHGMNRLAMYVNDILTGACHPNAAPTILKQTPATAWVDGEGALGATVGDFCMDLAIQKAKTCGVGWVSAKHSNHYGIAGWYAMRALDQGLIGMSFTNTSPLMAPTRSKKAALGTNPIAVGAPAENGDRFLLDMATTAVAVGKIEIQRRKGEPIPEGWAQDPEGNVTTDADLAFETACLMPLGGAETTSGYKGFGLGTMVEVLCGISAGSLYGHNIRSWSHQGVGGEANLGQCFIAVDPGCFAPGFQGRMSEMLTHIRGLEPVDPSKPVFIAGDKAAKNCARTDKEGTISYVPNQIKSCKELSEKLKIKDIVYTVQ